MLQVKPLRRDYQRHHRRVSRERQTNSMAARESTVAIINRETTRLLAMRRIASK